MTLPEPLQQDARSLPIGKTTADAYRAVFDHFPAFARAAFVPYLISLALWTLGLLVAESPFLPLLLSHLDVVPGTLFAVAWHRQILLGPAAGAPAFRPSWEARHWRFLAYSLAVMAVSYVPWAFPIATLGALVFVVFALVFYVLARFSFVFPAVAVDERYGFRHSWRHTEGHVWRLMATLVLAVLPLALLGGVVSAAGPMGKTLWAGGLSTALYYLTTGVWVTVLSIAFRTCTGWFPGPLVLSAGPGPKSSADSDFDDGA